MIVYDKTNIDRTQRNNQVPESKTIVKYVQQVSMGTNGLDAYQAFVSPNNCTFTEGSNQETKLVNVFAFRGSIQLDTSVGAIVCKDASGNTIPSTMLDTSVSYDGTNRTQITITKYGSLDKSEGQIVIPITYNLDMTDSSANLDSSTWDEDYGWSFQTFNVIFSWNKISSGDSVYSLDLSNENASINCDASGNVLAGARRPGCKATLYFGTQDVSTNVYYDASIAPDASVPEGSWSINHSTGVLTLNDGSSNIPFVFAPNNPEYSPLQISFTATVTTGGTSTQRGGTKIMNITKSIPGANGAAGPQGETGPQGAAGENGKDGTNGTNGVDAVSYWLEFSANQIKVDASDNVFPSNIIVSGWMQVGGNAPEPLPVPAEDEVSLYHLEMYINGDPEQGFDMPFDTSISVNNYRNFSYLQFKLIDDTNLVSLDAETVPILKDGKNGTNGTNGRTGAAIRGPIEWDGTLNRRFCSGEEDAVAPDTVDPEDVKWIDIIFRDGHYYRCTTSYYQTPPVSWDNVSSKWTLADAEYEFIATKLLLAENAKINFLTNNQLYLNDASGNITAGASGGSGVSFWAGGEDPDDASNNFIVDYHGNLTAKTGTFSGFIRIPYKSIGELSKESRYNGYGFMAGDYTNLRVYNQDSSITGAGCNITVRDSSTSATTRTINSPVLYLPEPTEDRVGMTYKILLPSVDYYRNSDLTPWLCIAVASQTSTDTSGKIEDSYHIAGPSRGVSIVAVYKGYIELTCLPVTKLGVNCSWYITNCSGPVDLYGPFKPTGGLLINDLYDISCSNVTTYAKSRSSSIVNRIVSDTTLSHTDSNTLYVEI